VHTDRSALAESPITAISAIAARYDSGDQPFAAVQADTAPMDRR